MRAPSCSAISLMHVMRALGCIALLWVAAGVASAAPADGMQGMSMDALEGARAALTARGADIAQAPGEIRLLFDAMSSALMSGSGVRAFTYLLILLLIGCGVEWLYWTYAYAPLRAIRAIPVLSRRHAFRLGLRRFGLLLAGLLLFAVTTIAASAAFTWPAGVHEAVVAATLMLAAIRLAWIVVATVLAPGPPHLAPLRLVDVGQDRVRLLAATTIAVSTLLAIDSFVPELLEQLAGAQHAAGALRLCIAMLIAVLLLAVVLFTTAKRAGAVRARRLPAFPQSFAVAVMIITVYVFWLLGTATSAAIAAIVAIVIVLQMRLRDLVFFFWSDDIAANARDRTIAAADALDPALVPSITLSALRFMVVLLGLGACAVALHAPMTAMAESQHFAVRLGFHLLGVAALVLFTHIVWIAIRTTIDHRLRRIGPMDSHTDTPNPNARLLTLLPLLRTTAAVLLLVMLVLSSLWALGIEITPLLAGAGVVGLALGFGAQALVRDIIAGIFFLAEDVFRIGEYIESGTTTRGTVERITLRTVALRHHNGPLHFVPYGSLGTVRNNSRDWVIEKFNLPLPIDVDSEKIRKMIKKIGAAMLDDAEVGHMLREPLKGKLYRIDPGVKIFRCKFETAPGNQFDVRAQAFKRIEAELKAMGVGFASGTQTVIVERPPELPLAGAAAPA